VRGAKLVKRSDSAKTEGASGPEVQRRRREAEALRQNLLKRKSQQRGRDDRPNPAARDEAGEKPEG
jgi:hypothetical protein